jgi:hypothetical protein
MRTRTLVLLATLTTVVAVWAAGLVRGGGSPDPVRSAVVAPATGGAATPRSGEERAVRVLHRWEAARAAAWSTADARALARLYAAGSRTGHRDVDALTGWRRRGLRVTGLREQVSSMGLVVVGRRRIVLDLSVRTVGGVAVGRRGARRPLPSSAWSGVRLELRRAHGSWRVVEASARRRSLPTT